MTMENIVFRDFCNQIISSFLHIQMKKIHVVHSELWITRQGFSTTNPHVNIMSGRAALVFFVTVFATFTCTI